MKTPAKKATGKGTTASKATGAKATGKGSGAVPPQFIKGAKKAAPKKAARGK